MKNFAEAVIAIAPMGSRKSRNRFFRDYDRWTNRCLCGDSSTFTSVRICVSRSQRPI